MSDKKYYWLKLKKDFFKRHDIEIIEDMPNGKDYVLFYLKLLVESVSHNGNLRFNDTIPYNENMLSTITHTNIDVVRSAMKLFTELNMIEILEDKTIYMSEVERMLGSETYWAEQKRKNRNIGQCPDNVKLVQVMSKQELETDIELDLEKEISSDSMKNSFQVYQENIGTLSPLTADKLKSFCDDLSDDLVCYAIEQSVHYNKMSMAYIEKILSSWILSNVKTRLDADNLKPISKTKETTSGKPNKFNNFEQRETDFTDLERKMFEKQQKELNQ